MARKYGCRGSCLLPPSCPPSPSGIGVALLASKWPFPAHGTCPSPEALASSLGVEGSGGGGVFAEPCEQTASELLADLRLRDSTSLPPSVTTYKLSLPSSAIALFFLLQLQTTAFPQNLASQF